MTKRVVKVRLLEPIEGYLPEAEYREPLYDEKCVGIDGRVYITSGISGSPRLVLTPIPKPEAPEFLEHVWIAKDANGDVWIYSHEPHWESHEKGEWGARSHDNTLHVHSWKHNLITRHLPDPFHGRPGGPEAIVHPKRNVDNE